MKHFRTFLVTLAILGLSISMAYADNAGALASQISGFAHGGTGTLSASVSGDTVTVTGTVVAVKNMLSLNISTGVKVVWKASYKGAETTLLPLIQLSMSGNGTFEIPAGGIILQQGSYGTAIANNFNTVNINGGTVQTISGPAIDNYGTVNISGGTVQTTYNEAIQNRSGATVNISGGTVQTTSGHAIDNFGTLIVSGGTVLSTSGCAINNGNGATVNITNGTVQTISGNAIDNGNGTVNISGGTVEATGNNGIAISISSNGKITISDNAVVTSANTDINKGTVYLASDGSNPDWRLKIEGGTVKNTTSGNAVCTDSEGEIMISGGMVFAKEGFAVKDLSYNGAVNISGGIVFAYADYADYVINCSFMLGFTGNSVVAGWKPATSAPYTYTANTSNDIYTFTESTTAVWANVGGIGGISVANGTNTGFIHIAGVTVNMSTPTYTVTVTNGTGSADYEDGDTVTITANPSLPEQPFKEWIIVPSVTFIDGTSATSETAKFIMPATHVTATATYEDETGIIDCILEKITVYPNPTNDILHFSLDTPFEIRDLQGHTLLKSEMAVKSLNVSKLPVGVYFITLSTDSGKTIRKIIKK